VTPKNYVFHALKTSKIIVTVFNKKRPILEPPENLTTFILTQLKCHADSAGLRGEPAGQLPGATTYKWH
jgi:hypothetical protein